MEPDAPAVDESEQPQEREDPDLEVPGSALDKDGKPLTVLRWLAETDDEKQRQQRLIDEAELRERIVLGEQWRASDLQRDDVLPASDLTGVAGVISENLLYPLCLTWAARVDQGRVDPRAYPFQPTAGDVESAKALNTILDYEKQKCAEGELISEAAILAQCHGDVLFYPQWSEADGPFKVRRQKVDKAGPAVDTMGNPVMEDAWEFGGVVEEVIAAPDYLTSGQDHYKQCEWLRVRRIIPKAVARERLKKAGFPHIDPQENDYPTALETARRGVEAFELWMKPGPRCPNGAFAIVIQKIACIVMEYPKHPETGKVIYDGQLPGDVWKIGYIRGCSRGKTHVSDAIHQQRLINTTLRSILARAEVAASAYLIGPESITDQMPNAKTRRIGNDNPDVDIRAQVGWFAGPEVPSTLLNIYERARAALHDVFGVSEATVSGGDPTETKSGKQLRDATALDAQKIRPARGYLEQARKKVAKDKATLWQVHADDARLVRVLGPAGAVQAEWLRGADIGGADVALEIGSGIQSTRLAGQRYAEESAEAGYLDPVSAAERRETGLAQTVGEADADARVDAQAKAAMQGQMQPPMPDVDPARAVARLQTTIASVAMQGQDPAPIVALAQAYQQLAAANAQAMDQGAGAMQQAAAPQKGAVATTPTRQQTGGMEA